MADALCGPSNALQSFQKHTTVDRTLQQDRLTSRHSPSQGFRSSPGPNAGLLDPEFEAFQAGQVPLPHPEAQGFSTAFSNVQIPHHQQAPEPGKWAGDFQRQNILPLTPQFEHNYGLQSQQRQVSGRWQNEFAQQQNQAPAPSHYAGYNSLPYERLSTIAPMTQSWLPTQMSQMGMSTNQGQINESQQETAEAFDEEAFARAFDDAERLETKERGDLFEEETGKVIESQKDMEASREIVSDYYTEERLVGADAIYDERQQAGETQRPDDPDALARTAGQLLDSVRDNQSEKFQKSQFLELMRQLRDREVMVEGDKIVGVHAEDRDALEKSLLSIARQLSHLDFTRVEPLLASTTNNAPLLLPLHQNHHPRPVDDQLTLGAFIHTLQHVSAALDSLTLAHPDLLQRAQPFGLSIGVEVFALAANPLLPAFPALQALVLSFKAQFEALAIDPRMVRRASDEPLHHVRPAATTASGTQDTLETPLRAWLEDWLVSVPARRRSGVEWLFSPAQLRDLLGEDVYREQAPGAAREQDESRPQQRHLDRVLDIFGPSVLRAMLAIWHSPHARIFVNPVIASAEEFVEYVDELRGVQGGEGEEAEVRLEEVFPLRRGKGE